MIDRRWENITLAHSNLKSYSIQFSIWNFVTRILDELQLRWIWSESIQIYLLWISFGWNVCNFEIFESIRAQFVFDLKKRQQLEKNWVLILMWWNILKKIQKPNSEILDEFYRSAVDECWKIQLKQLKIDPGWFKWDETCMKFSFESILLQTFTF
jgi:hypothetical protein